MNYECPGCGRPLAPWTGDDEFACLTCMDTFDGRDLRTGGYA